MVEYSNVTVKLSNSQLNKLKTAVKKKNRSNFENEYQMFRENNLRHELFLTTRQKTNLRNAFESNI